MSPTAPTSEGVRRMARELAEFLKESGRPRETMAVLESVMSAEHGVDVRAAKTFAEQWAEACRPRTEEENRAIYARLRAEFKPEDAEKYLSGGPVVPFEQVIAELEDIQRQSEPPGK